MASIVKSNLRSCGIEIQEGFGSPTHMAAKGTLYIRVDATTTTTRLWINTDGGVTWAYFTSSS
jgi:hypothetical protein